MDPSVRIDRADIESAKPYQLNELLALAGMEVADEPGGRPRRLVGSQPSALSHDLTRRDNAGAASSKVQQLYLVENVSTSKYNRVDTANDALSQPQARRSHRQSVSAQRPHFQLNAADSILSGAEMLFRGAQGLLAGAALLAVILIHNYETNASLIQGFSGVAAVIQKLLYVLSTLALIGAGHEVVRRRGKRLIWLRMPTVERYRLWGVLGLYALALLAGLLSVRTDDYLAAELKSSSGSYKATAGDAVGFWKAMAYVRAVCALLAWLLVISTPAVKSMLGPDDSKKGHSSGAATPDGSGALSPGSSS